MSPEPKAHAEGESAPKRAKSTGPSAADLRAEALEKGYMGEVPGPDNEEYALTSGPESPSAAEALLAAAEAQLEEQRASTEEKG